MKQNKQKITSDAEAITYNLAQVDQYPDSL